jgi:hypothetical protein
VSGVGGYPSRFTESGRGPRILFRIKISADTRRRLEFKDAAFCFS